MRLSAKSVVLELLSAAAPRPGPSRLLVSACKLFGISENSTRVTLARLLGDGTLETTARGTYRLGAGTEGLTRQVTAWRTLEAQAVRWDGAWVGVFTGELPRSERVGLRRRDRALRLLGFGELARGLSVRPDNLRGGIAALRDRLGSLGLDPAAPVFEARFEGPFEARARALWDGRALTASYRATRKRLDRWLAREAALDRDAAARESFLLGREALRQVLFDPLLPDALVDVDERRAFVSSARRFDDVGRRIWSRRFGVDRSLADTPDAALAASLRAQAVH